MDLGIDLSGGEALALISFISLGKGSLDDTGDFHYMGLGSELSGSNSVLLLDGEDQAQGNESLGKLEGRVIRHLSNRIYLKNKYILECRQVFIKKLYHF